MKSGIIPQSKRQEPRTNILTIWGEIAPQFLGFLGCVADEGVNGFAADGAQPALGAGFQPSGDLFRQPSFGEAIAKEDAERPILFDRRFTPPSPPRGAAGRGG